MAYAPCITKTTESYRILAIYIILDMVDLKNSKTINHIYSTYCFQVDLRFLKMLNIVTNILTFVFRRIFMVYLRH